VEVDKILPYSRFAYDPVDDDQTALCDIFAKEGGSWVWRYDNGIRRDYFVGNQKVIQYFVKKAQGDEQPKDKTIVGKQWISKETLEESGYEYKEYGEGSYAILQKLTPVGYSLSK